MDWQLRDRGFLPTPDPLWRLDGAASESIEQFAADVPALVASRRFRDAVPQRLREPIDWLALDENSAGPRAERLFKLYSYFASAYVHAPGLPPVRQLPREIAVPLVRLADRCGRP